MSHFVLHVFTPAPPNGENNLISYPMMDKIMDRYDENREVEPYVDSFVPFEEAQDLRDKHGPGESVGDFIAAWYGGDEVRWSSDRNGYEVITTSNPESKWDWWVAGGRWEGGLIVKGGEGVDSTQVKNLAWDDHIAELITEANKRYDKFQEVTAGLEVPPSYRQLLEVGQDPTTARANYLSEPWVQAARSLDPLSMLTPHEQFHVGKGGRDSYVYQETGVDVPHAWIDLEGEWHERGEMGWFGVFDKEKEFAEHVSAYRAYRDSLPGDTYITLIDCHI